MAPRQPRKVGTMKVGGRSVPDLGKRQGKGVFGGNKATKTGARVDPVPAARSPGSPKPSKSKNASEAAGQTKGTKKSARKQVTKAKKKAGGGQKKAAQKPASGPKKKAATERNTKKAAKKSSKTATTPRKTSGPKRAKRTPGKRATSKKSG